MGVVESLSNSGVFRVITLYFEAMFKRESIFYQKYIFDIFLILTSIAREIKTNSCFFIVCKLILNPLGFLPVWSLPFSFLELSTICCCKLGRNLLIFASRVTCVTIKPVIT